LGGLGLGILWIRVVADSILNSTIVQLRCDTVYVLHGFIPVEETGMVSAVMGTVVEMGTYSVPMKNPNHLDTFAEQGPFQYVSMDLITDLPP